MKIRTLALSSLLLACGGAPAHDAELEAAMAQHRHDHAAHAARELEEATHHGAHHHGFEDPASWSERWESPERDAWQKPDAVLDALAIAPDALIADIGAGTGYFAARLARRAPQGTVYAADLEPAMVKWLAERARTEGLTNLEAVQATTDDAKLPQPVDLVMLTNTYHHISDRTPYFTRLREHLRPGGRVAIVDYKLHFEGHGPPQAMRLAPDTVVEEMKAAGYQLAHRDEELLPRQYLVVFEALEGEPHVPR